MRDIFISRLCHTLTTKMWTVFMVTVWVVTQIVTGLPPFAILPDVPSYVDANADLANLRQFVDLWKDTLQNDGQGDAPTRRINFGGLTINTL